MEQGERQYTVFGEAQGRIEEIESEQDKAIPPYFFSLFKSQLALIRTKNECKI